MYIIWEDGYTSSVAVHKLLVTIRLGGGGVGGGEECREVILAILQQYNTKP